MSKPAEMIGLSVSSDEIRDLVIERAAGQVAEAMLNEYQSDIRYLVRKTVEAVARERMDTAIRPLVEGGVESITLQKTNEWGEAKGGSLTFREYLVQRAEAYLTETVNHEGKPKGSDAYSWKGTQTRVMHMVNQHLHYEVERAMKQALSSANSTIVDGLEKALKVKLAEISAALKVTVKTE